MHIVNTKATTNTPDQRLGCNTTTTGHVSLPKNHSSPVVKKQTYWACEFQVPGAEPLSLVQFALGRVGMSLPWSRGHRA